MDKKTSQLEGNTEVVSVFRVGNDTVELQNLGGSRTRKNNAMISERRRWGNASKNLPCSGKKKKNPESSLSTTKYNRGRGGEKTGNYSHSERGMGVLQESDSVTGRGSTVR